jgi:hypothetical protein
MNKAVKPDYIAHEIAVDVKHHNIFGEKRDASWIVQHISSA